MIWFEFPNVRFVEHTFLSSPPCLSYSSTVTLYLFFKFKTFSRFSQSPSQNISLLLRIVVVVSQYARALYNTKSYIDKSIISIKMISFLPFLFCTIFTFQSIFSWLILSLFKKFKKNKNKKYGLEWTLICILSHCNIMIYRRVGYTLIYWLFFLVLCPFFFFFIFLFLKSKQFMTNEWFDTTRLDLKLMDKRDVYTTKVTKAYGDSIGEGWEKSQQ